MRLSSLGILVVRFPCLMSILRCAVDNRSFQSEFLYIALFFSKVRQNKSNSNCSPQHPLSTASPPIPIASYALNPPSFHPFGLVSSNGGFRIDGYDEGGGELGRIEVLGVRGLGC